MCLYLSFSFLPDSFKSQLTRCSFHTQIPQVLLIEVTQKWGFYPLLCLTVPLKDDERMTDDIPWNGYICKTNTESVTEFACVCTIDICCVYAVCGKLYHLILTSRYIFNLYFITFPCLLFTVKGLKVQYVCLSVCWWVCIQSYRRACPHSFFKQV